MSLSNRGPGRTQGDAVAAPSRVIEIQSGVLFESLMGRSLVLSREFRVVAVSPLLLAESGSNGSSIVGRHIFDVLREEPGSGGTLALNAALRGVLERAPVRPEASRVFRTWRPGQLSQLPGDREWSCLVSPLLDPEGDVERILLELFERPAPE